MVHDCHGFTGRPFRLTPDPASLFESLSHRRALSCLAYSIAQSEGVVVVTGDMGAGKSTLVRHFLATTDQSLLTTAMVTSGRFDGDAIVSTIARAFGRAAKSRNSTDFAAIERFLEQEARAGRRCLLVVDDAQNLSVAALQQLRQLSVRRSGKQPVLQILLVGQPGLRDLLKTHPELEQLRQCVIASLQLDALEAGEVERYVHHRLTGIGWSGKPTFAPDVFSEVHAATAGLPGRIDQIANRLLLLAAAWQQQHIDGVLLGQVLQELYTNQTVQPTGPVLKTQLEIALARCQSQIAELQQAHTEMAQGQDRDALLERLSNLEGRVIEQERTIRHTMTILIEWIERDEALSVAA